MTTARCPPSLSVPVRQEPARYAERNLAQIVQRQHALVWRTLRRMGVPERDADDAAQHVFWIFAQRANHIERDHDVRYLLSVTFKVAANVRRKLKRLREVGGEHLEDRSGEHSPESLLEQKQLCAELDRGLSRLSDDHRAVFVLFEIEGLSLPEIARALGIPLGTATSRLRRARDRFEAWLREQPDALEER